MGEFESQQSLFTTELHGVKGDCAIESGLTKRPHAVSVRA